MHNVIEDDFDFSPVEASSRHQLVLTPQRPWINEIRGLKFDDADAPCGLSTQYVPVKEVNGNFVPTQKLPDGIYLAKDGRGNAIFFIAGGRLYRKDLAYCVSFGIDAFRKEINDARTDYCWSLEAAGVNLKLRVPEDSFPLSKGQAWRAFWTLLRGTHTKLMKQAEDEN